jgi:hypothetical protein
LVFANGRGYVLNTLAGAIDEFCDKLQTFWYRRSAYAHRYRHVERKGRAEEIRLDEVKIPVIIPGSSRPASVALEAIVLRPDDGLPHPLAVLNHAHREMRATAPR